MVSKIDPFSIDDPTWQDNGFPFLHSGRFQTRHLIIGLMFSIVGFSSLSSLQGQGTVVVSFSSRGDLLIVGDQSSNSLTVSQSGDEFRFEGSAGTEILLNAAGRSPQFGEIVALPMSDAILLRKISVDLKQGRNTLVVFDLPELVTGNIDVKVDVGDNLIFINPSNPVTVMGNISVKGKRAPNATHTFILGDQFFGNSDITVLKKVNVNLSARLNQVALIGVECEGLSSSMGGGGCDQSIALTSVLGQASIKSNGSDVGINRWFGCRFKGQTSITTGNAPNLLNIEHLEFRGRVSVKMGRSNDEIIVRSANFYNNKAAQFDGGKGANGFVDNGNNHFEVPPKLKNF
jgi:hypothetical protein